MNCFETLNCHFELNAHIYYIYQVKLQAVVTGSCGEWYRAYSLWAVCDQPSGLWVVRTQEQRGYSTSLSLAPATGLPAGKAAGLLSLQEPKAHFCGHPSLKTSCCTQCRSPLRACKDTDALKAISFPLHFHNTYWWKSHQLWQLCTSTHQDRTAGGSHTVQVAKEHSPFWANAGKIVSQVLQQHVEKHVHVGQLPSAWLFYF